MCKEKFKCYIEALMLFNGKVIRFGYGSGYKIAYGLWNIIGIYRYAICYSMNPYVSCYLLPSIMSIILPRYT